MSDDDFLTAFEECTLARADWTHEAHVRMAWLYLTRSSSYRAARDKVRDGIKKLNDTFAARVILTCMRRKPDGPKPRSTGYHDTITMVFVRLVAVRLQPGDDFPAFRERNPDLFDRTFPALLKHYSPGRLYSEEAKAAFIEPDLEPLPKV